MNDTNVTIPLQKRIYEVRAKFIEARHLIPTTVYLTQDELVILRDDLEVAATVGREDVMRPDLVPTRVPMPKIKFGDQVFGMSIRKRIFGDISVSD